MALKRFCLFSGNANPELAAEIARVLDTPLGEARVTHFSDAETFIEIRENVRGLDTYIVQPTCQPVNDNLMELLIMCDALRRASAASITAVIPYYGYARQDRKVAPRTPITSKLVADLLVTAGISRVVCVDLHAGQIQGFFNIPFDHLHALPVFLDDYLKVKFDREAVFISPDAGGVERARAFAKRLKADLGIIDKRRPAENVAEIVNVIGDVSGRTCVLVDDLVDTAGTLVKAAEVLKQRGATKVLAFCTHPVLSGAAVARVNDSCLERLIVTNTIPLGPEKGSSPKIKVLSVAALFGEAIKRTHEESSITSLFT